MARNTSFTPYEEETVGAFDEEPGGPEFMDLRICAFDGAEGLLLPEDPMPLFLSGGAEETQTAGLRNRRREDLERAAVWPRIFKAGILAASAAAIAFAILSGRQSARAVCGRQGFAARHSGGSVRRHANPQSTTRSRGANGQPRCADAGLAINRRRQGLVADREGHADARRYRFSRSGPPSRARCKPIRRPRPRPPAPPVRRLDPDELAALLKRAKGFDRDRRHRACAAVARTGSGRARGQRCAAAGADLRPGRAWNAGYAKHHSRSGDGA